MFKISYQIFPQHLRIKDEKISETDVEYYLFPGQIIFVSDTGTFDISWGWITVLDLAIFFKRICLTLSQEENGTNQYGFTESDEVIDIRREGEQVELHLSFDDSNMIVNFEEFCDEVDRFYNSVVDEVCTANPFLREKQDFLQLLNTSIKKPLN